VAESLKIAREIGDVRGVQASFELPLGFASFGSMCVGLFVTGF